MVQVSRVASGFSVFHNGQTTLSFRSWPLPTSLNFVCMLHHLNQQSSSKVDSLSHDTTEYFLLSTLGIVSLQYLNHTRYMVNQRLLYQQKQIAFKQFCCFFAVFANSELKLSAPSCVFLSLFSTCGTNPDHVWPESTHSHSHIQNM